MNIFITGGASGLGASIVCLLAAQKQNTIYFTYSKSSVTALAMEAEFSNVHAIHCDFSDKTSVDSCLELLPGIQPNVLINNAYGSIHKDHFYRTDYNVFCNSFETNVVPTLRITQEAIKIFRKLKFGRIVNIISSAVINKPPIGWAEYVANKAYLMAMSKVWATECIKFNVSSNCISPSFMLTKLTSDTDDRIVEQMIESHPLRKLLTTNEVAEAVLFFIHASTQVNGTNLVINAGTDLI